MMRTVLQELAATRIVVMDSISLVTSEDSGQIVVAGSNGGMAAGRVGTAARCRLVVLNDAGVGADGAGIAALTELDRHGIPAATVSHESAEISDGMDMWENGVISHVNRRATQAGLAVGEPVKQAVLRFAQL